MEAFADTWVTVKAARAARAAANFMVVVEKAGGGSDGECEGERVGWLTFSKAENEGLAELKEAGAVRIRGRKQTLYISCHCEDLESILLYDRQVFSVELQVSTKPPWHTAMHGRPTPERQLLKLRLAANHL